MVDYINMMVMIMITWFDEQDKIRKAENIFYSHQPHKKVTIVAFWATIMQFTLQRPFILHLRLRLTVIWTQRLAYKEFTRTCECRWYGVQLFNHGNWYNWRNQNSNHNNI